MFQEIVDWKLAHHNLLEYVAQLEQARRDLWGINEELHLKVQALERGQEDLLLKLADTSQAPCQVWPSPCSSHDEGHI